MIEKVKATHPLMTYCCGECGHEDIKMWVFSPYKNQRYWFCSRICYKKLLNYWLNS